MSKNPYLWMIFLLLTVTLPLAILATNSDNDSYRQGFLDGQVAGRASVCTNMVQATEQYVTPHSHPGILLWYVREICNPGHGHTGPWGRG